MAGLLLKQLLHALVAIENKSKRVRFDFCGFYPDMTTRGVHSFGADLELGFVGPGVTAADGSMPPAPTCEAFLEVMRCTLGKTYRGLAGYEMTVHGTTKVRVGKRGGPCGCTLITGVYEPEDRHGVVLRTAYFESAPMVSQDIVQRAMK